MLCDIPYKGQSDVRAIVGARVSNVRGDEQTSHITQRSKGDASAESQDWTVVGAFEDLDVSAIKLSPRERPDLKAWLTDRADDWVAAAVTSAGAVADEFARFLTHASVRRNYKCILSLHDLL